MLIAIIVLSILLLISIVFNAVLVAGNHALRQIIIEDAEEIMNVHRLGRHHRRSDRQSSSLSKYLGIDPKYFRQ